MQGWERGTSSRRGWAWMRAVVADERSAAERWAELVDAFGR